MTISPRTSGSGSPGPRRRGATQALTAFAAALLGAGALTACGSSGGSAGAGGDGPSVVASTNVYADIVEQVAGGNATVEAVISDPAADPHSYEASPADAAKVSNADLVVYNGGGYDSFVDLALENAGEVPVVRAVDEYSAVTGEAAPEHSHDHGDDAGGSHDGHDHGDDDGHEDESNDEGQGGHAGHDHSHDAASNEHVWFSLPTTTAVAEQVASQLAEIDPEHADDYRANAQSFGDALTPVQAQLDEIHDRGHFPYAQTERIGAHLLDYAHMVDRTPRGFLTSVEDDTDPSAADLASLIDLLDRQEVAVLAYNPQTETAVTARVREAAVNGGVVVVEISETLPEGTDYVTWMSGIVNELADALAGAAPVDDDEH